jgi:hypothetical protein
LFAYLDIKKYIGGIQMTKTVGRNDLCPCGSGKKYKKCCDQQQVISIHHLLKNEVHELQKDLYEFAVTNYGPEIEEDFAGICDDLIYEDEEDESFYQFAHACWFMLFCMLDDESTVLEKYIMEQSHKIKRPKLKQILLSWQEASPIVGKVVHLTDEEFVVEELWTKETYDCIAFDEKPSYEGAYIIGLALPFEQQYVFFPFAFQVTDKVEVGFEDFIQKLFKSSGYDDFTEYMIESFIEILNMVPYSQGMVDVNEMDWEEPIYLEVAEQYIEAMKANRVSQVAIDIGIILWNQFCQLRKKKIKNSGIYVAALQYMVSSIFDAIDHSQNEIGQKYGVSGSAVSKAVLEMESVLAEQISEMDFSPMDFYEEDSRGLDKDFDEVYSNVFQEDDGLTTNELVPPINRAKAQDLLYSAFDENGKKRYQLARQALELNPYDPDAYNLLAEQATSKEEALILYKTGLEKGEVDLGKAFFKKNSGYFWGLIETRPYMRAKLNYAFSLLELELDEIAIKQFKELLTLNPNDNQGARYILFIALIRNNRVHDAKALLDKYPEEDARGFFNKLLVELLQNGYTAKATKLKKTAIKENPFVIDYLVKKKKLPKQLPETYSFGDKNEAIVYVSEHGHLWSMIGIKEWLDK